MAVFSLYLPDAVLAAVDELRGAQSRSSWVREAVGARLELREAATGEPVGDGGVAAPSPTPTHSLDPCGSEEHGAVPGGLERELGVPTEDPSAPGAKFQGFPPPGPDD